MYWSPVARALSAATSSKCSCTTVGASRVVDDLSGGDRANLPVGVAFVLCDITDPALDGRFRGARVRCSDPLRGADLRAACRSRTRRLTGTSTSLARRMSCAARQATGVGRFVFFSSGGAVYGDTAVRADETTLPAPLSPYGAHKLAAESYVALSGLSYAILRPANVYGPRQRAGTDGGVIADLRGSPRTRRTTHDQWRRRAGARLRLRRGCRGGGALGAIVERLGHLECRQRRGHDNQ